MSKSLQDQLLQAGLVNAKQVKQAKAAKTKQKKQQRRRPNPETDTTRLELQQKARQKAEHDRELNRKRELKSQQRAISAQIKQLVDTNHLAEDEEGEPFHFEHKKKIKKVYVSNPVRAQIIGGDSAIVTSAHRYWIVPKEIGLKIQTLRATSLVFLQDANRPAVEGMEQVDPAYAKHTIPDDLMW